VASTGKKKTMDMKKILEDLTLRTTRRLTKVMLQGVLHSLLKMFS
jgi:hypothetical protein